MHKAEWKLHEFFVWTRPQDTNDDGYKWSETVELRKKRGRKHNNKHNTKYFKRKNSASLNNITKISGERHGFFLHILITETQYGVFVFVLLFLFIYVCTGNIAPFSRCEWFSARLSIQNENVLANQFISTMWKFSLLVLCRSMWLTTIPIIKATARAAAAAAAARCCVCILYRYYLFANGSSYLFWAI